MATRLSLAAIAVFILFLLPCSAPLPSWQVYTFQDGSFTLIPASSFPSPFLPHSHTPLLPHSHTPFLPYTPPDWHITAAVLADVTDDGAPEWVLLVWRRWRDWPIQRWLPVPSPIAGFHDAAGDSCHLILLDPRDGREIWAGSALPAPLLALAVGDVDGDGRHEVVTLEGDYATGRDGPATRIDVWRWNGFGFMLEWRSPPGAFRQLRLTDGNNDGILDIAVRREEVKMMPALREILEGYKRFNAWELEEQKRELPWLTVEESLMQFFELCDLARALAPNAERIFLEQDEAHWIALHQKLERAAEVVTDAQTT